ncbi:MAG: DUF7009 family protein [Bacteroidia bacterium]
MKLRIKGNSIRIRLSKSEVDYFGTNAYLEERIEFGNSELVYAIQSKANSNEISANFEGNTIIVTIPENLRNEWIETDRIGLANKIDIGMGKQLLLLIEKDFVCLDNTLEDQSDNYPNPNAVC